MGNNSIIRFAWVRVSICLSSARNDPDTQTSHFPSLLFQLPPPPHNCYLFLFILSQAFFYSLLLTKMLLAFFLFQWPIKPYPGIWWYFPGTHPFTNTACHLVQQGPLSAKEPPLAILWSRVEWLCLSPCVQLHSSGIFHAESSFK